MKYHLHSCHKGSTVSPEIQSEKGASFYKSKRLMCLKSLCPLENIAVGDGFALSKFYNSIKIKNLKDCSSHPIQPATNNWF